jgi:hypothetical protein
MLDDKTANTIYDMAEYSRIRVSDASVMLKALFRPQEGTISGILLDLNAAESTLRSLTDWLAEQGIRGNAVREI